MSDLHPIHHLLVSLEERIERQQHRPLVLWMTGLSGSGKSTLAAMLERCLFEEGLSVVVLDGDNLRSGINSDLGFSEADRQENIRRVAEIARLFAMAGHIVICTFISPTAQMRALAAERIGEDFREVFIDAPLSVCEHRDVKGLYRKARQGELRQFTGVDAPYEPPLHPHLHLHTSGQAVAESCDQLYLFVKESIALL
jgi:adenylylsulfate kinase